MGSLLRRPVHTSPAWFVLTSYSTGYFDIQLHLKVNRSNDLNELKGYDLNLLVQLSYGFGLVNSNKGPEGALGGHKAFGA